jgi:hypothetical protein
VPGTVFPSIIAKYCAESGHNKSAKDKKHSFDPMREDVNIFA